MFAFETLTSFTDANLFADSGPSLVAEVHDAGLYLDRPGLKRRKILGVLRSTTKPRYVVYPPMLLYFICLLYNLRRDISVPFVALSIAAFDHECPSTGATQRGFHVSCAVIPLRLFVDTHVISFIKALSPVPREQSSVPTRGSLVAIERLSVGPLKVKLTYLPSELDVHQLGLGDYIQLLNIVPVDCAEVNLKPFRLEDVAGFEDLSRLMTERWVKDIFETQLYSLVRGTLPLKGLVNVGSEVATLTRRRPAQKRSSGMKVLGELRKGSAKIINAIARESFDASHKLAHLAAKNLAELANDQENLLSQPSDVEEGYRQAWTLINRRYITLPVT